MKWLFPLVAIVLMALAIWTLTDRSTQATRSRKVAFDNLYGNAERLTIHVRLDGGDERALQATCDPKVCTFDLEMTNARHELVIAVEQNGVRGGATSLTLDTSGLR